MIGAKWMRDKYITQHPIDLGKLRIDFDNHFAKYINLEDNGIHVNPDFVFNWFKPYLTLQSKTPEVK
jgi:hypothetical protein